ncbi:MAG: flagellar biosynthesis protein FlhF [Methylophilus sp.]|nr:flagellar biosynthesis protein FlhF [Methylophilus sp.]
MNIKRFFGKNSREALTMAKKALGEDAVIVSNRSVSGGIEIMAISESEMHAMATNESVQHAAPHHTNASNNMLEDAHTLDLDGDDYQDAPTLLSILNQNKSGAKAPKAIQKSIIEPEEITTPAPQRNDFMFKTEQSNHTSNQELTEKINFMLNEMRNMRSRMESQLTAMTWSNHLQNNPVKSKILSTLLAANFSASLSRQLAEKMPNDLEVGKATTWVKNVLANNMHTIQDESELLNQGGVFALVGPTGVGKTTTTAKLAARYVMKHGTQKLGLITTDGYRIGGHEQLRIYGKILGVMVHAVKDEADLKIALNELRNKHTILIDTVGVSQRDRMVTEQVAMLTNTNINIKKLLCLNATSTGETLSDVIRAYKGRALDGCIITKLDEAASIGNVLDVIIREKIKLYYTTHGQRVPEDMQLANKKDLISRALTLNPSSWPFQFLDEELPFVVSTLQTQAETGRLMGVGHV